MKPAWDQLMGEFKDSKTALVGDVDCTKEDNEALCSKNGVEGYPTIKWGKIGALKDYDGGREFEEMMEFAKANLGPVCGPKSLAECDETQKKQITEYMALKDEDLQKQMKEKEAAVEALEKEFEAELKKLEEKHTELAKAKTDKVDVIKTEGLASMQMVWKDRHPPPPPPPMEEEEDAEGENGDLGDEDGEDGDDGPEGDDGSEAKKDDL